MSVTRDQLIRKLFLLEELDDPHRTSELPEGDLSSLRAVANWITTFIVRPHKDLGRAGPVCPFARGAMERKTLWLTPERVGEGGVPEVAELIRSYQTLFKATLPTGGDDATLKSFVIVFTDLSPRRADEFFGAVLEQLAVPSYVTDGFVMGGFHEGNAGTAIYNAKFRPFTSPVPFLLMRHAVVTDWKFFLDDEDWFKRWERRYPDSGVEALAEELRRLPWRGRGAADGSHPTPTDAS